MRIVFMGTPDFAVASLQRLVENVKNVVAVITAPDKPVGRGQTLRESPVKKFALAHSIPVLQPEKLKNKEFLEILATYKADFQVVVAFRMLPKEVWAMPKLGTINLHGSLLPQYRGAAPINWAIINGERETGITTFFIEEEIDTGKIIYSEKIAIGLNETAGDLHDKMMWMGGALVVKTVNAISSGQFPKIEQNFSDLLKPAPKIFKETCRIDWSKDSLTIYNFIRGLSPFPAAWTMLGERQIKIFQVEIINDIKNIPLTTFSFSNENIELEVFSDQKKYFVLKTSDSYVSIQQLQLEGKKRMNTEEFLRGFRF